MSYAWSEKRHRDGAVLHRLQCPLLRGEHRPEVYVAADGRVYAKAISGYSRVFADAGEALAWAGAVPMRVGGFVREGV